LLIQIAFIFEDSLYFDGFAQSVAGQRLGKHVPTRNNSVEVFSSCPRMDLCYTMRAR
jgi:hypothetical protein